MNRRLEPDWDDHNTMHIARHGVAPEQVEEVYYSEGPWPTLAVDNPRRRGTRSSEPRLRLWGTDARGLFLELIVALYPDHGVWRCVTARQMSPSTRAAYLKRVRGRRT